MSLKFATTRRALGSPVDVAAAEEALIESIGEVASAAEALYEAGADGAELCQVIDNITLAVEAVNNGGLTPEFLATFNGAGEVCDCAGVEALSVAGLKKLGASQVAQFQDRLTSGLEGKLAEYWAKFVTWLKNMWAKLVNWFKSIFVNRARYIKVLTPVQNLKESDWNGKAKTSALNIPKSEYTKLLNFEKTILKSMTDFELGKDINREECDKAVKVIEAIFDKDRKEATVDTIFGDLKTFKETVSYYCTVYAPGKGIQATTAKIDKAFPKLIVDAEKAAAMKDEGKSALAKDSINRKRETLVYVLMLIRVENRFAMKWGGQLYKGMKAGLTKKEVK